MQDSTLINSPILSNNREKKLVSDQIEGHHSFRIWRQINNEYSIHKNQRFIKIELQNQENMEVTTPHTTFRIPYPTSCELQKGTCEVRFAEDKYRKATSHNITSRIPQAMEWKLHMEICGRQTSQIHIPHSASHKLRKGIFLA